MRDTYEKDQEDEKAWEEGFFPERKRATEHS
jgi:hypothetical protein